MDKPPSQTELVDAERTWREIEDQLDQLASLARSNVTPEVFFRQLLDRCVNSLAAVGGAVWICDSPDSLRLAYHINLRQTGLDQSAAQQAHTRLLDEALHAGESFAAAPHATAETTVGSESELGAANPTRYVALLGPVLVDDQPAAVIEILMRPGRSPTTQEGFLKFLDAVCELASDFQRGQQLRSLRTLQTKWNELDQFARRIHDSLNLEQTAAAIVNDGRRLIGCDRVSLVIQRGSRSRVAAISGVDTFDRRSNVVRLQQKLTRLMIRADEPLWYGEGQEEIAPEIEPLLHSYLDVSQSRSLVVLPLTKTTGEGRRQKSRRLGALVIENFAAPLDAQQCNDTTMVAEHSRVALTNALDLRNVPLMPLWRMMARIGWLMRLRQLPITLTVLAIIAGAGAALILVPADFHLDAPGQLQPVVRKHIFAPADGIVDQLAAEHGKPIASGQTLLTLRRSELDLESERITGEMKTVSKRLSAVQAARLADPPSDPEGRARYRRLSSEEEEIKEQLRGLDAQFAILEEQRKRLSVTSPIDGRVITWDVARKLTSRPVSRGQQLMTVADLDGPWVIEVEMPDDQIGHVLAAQEQLENEDNPEQLTAKFMLETQPGIFREGKVQDIALTTDHDKSQTPTVLITIEMNTDELRTGKEEPLRPGAGATVQIQCGQRPLGYVWFRGVIEAVERWWF